jgi:hypothetical protein
MFRRRDRVGCMRRAGTNVGNTCKHLEGRPTETGTIDVMCRSLIMRTRIPHKEECLRLHTLSLRTQTGMTEILDESKNGEGPHDR